MKKIRVAIVFLISVIFLCNQSYAKYYYNFENNIIKLSRDTIPPICNISYSTEEWTNQSVVITIKCNKEIEQVSGFELSEDKKVLSKEIFENEEGVIRIRDFSGNYTDVEYSVKNIDKELPQIIGCQDGGIHDAPLKLDYYDNIGIKEIMVDRYNDTLTIEYKEKYCDSVYFYGIDRTKATLTLNVTGHPQNTVNYKYYINEQLYATTSNASYTFTGLKEGTDYEMKVQALDSQGNVLAEVVQEAKTSYFGRITSQKSESQFLATLENLSSQVATVSYAVWNFYDSSNYIWYESKITDGNAEIKCSPFEGIEDGSYVINAYMFDKNGEPLEYVAFLIDFNSNYVEKDQEVDKYNLKLSGNYQIKVSDLAENEIIYYIKVK